MNRRLFLRKIISLCITMIIMFSLIIGNVENAAAAPMAEGGNEIASAVLGTKVETLNCTVSNGDGLNPIAVFEQGKEAWKLDPSQGTSNRYIYVNIDDSLLFNKTDGTILEVEIEYYDAEDTSMSFEYPKFKWTNVSTEKPKYGDIANKTNATELEIVDFQGTGQWKSYTWTLDRAWLNNSMNGNDFRICAYTPIMQYSKNPILIHSIKVRDTGLKDTMDINVKSDNIGHIFFTGDTMKFDIEVDNSVSYYSSLVEGDIDAEIVYTVTDSKNYVVANAAHDAKIKAAQKYSDTFEFMPEKYDCYILHVEVKSKDGRLYSDVERECSYVRSTKGEIVNERAGISLPTWLTNYPGAEKDYADQTAKLLNYAGFRYARVHYAMDQVAMSAYDKYYPNEMTTHTTFGESFKALKDNNVKLMLYCNNFANNFNAATASDSSVWIEEEGRPVPHTPKGRQRMYNIEQAIISENSGSVDVWEIGNEPNLSTTIETEDKHALDMAMYDQFAYPKLKKDFPNILIGTSQISGFNTLNTWFKDYFEAGGNINQDFISFHPYSAVFDTVNGSVMNRNNIVYGGRSVMDLVDLCEEYNYNGELWATEYGKSPGWYGCPKDDWYQAVWNTCAYINMTEGDYIDKMILFRLDRAKNESRNTIENSYGIIRTMREDVCENASAACPAYLSSANLNLMMYDAEYKEKFYLNDNTAGFRYKKTQTDEDMLIMFGRNDLDIVSVDLGVNSVELTDMYGNQKTITSDDGVYTFSVTMDPFYCTGKFKKFEIVDKSEAYPKQTNISAIYNGEVEVDVVNNTDKTLSAEFVFDGKSQSKIVSDCTVKPGVTTLKLKCGAEHAKPSEKIGLRLTDRTNTYFDGYVVLNYGKNIKLDTELHNKNGQWSVAVTVDNLSSDTVSGEIKMMYPPELADSMEPVEAEVAPLSSKVFELKMSDSVTLGESVLATVAFESNGKVEAYNTERLDFVYVSKAHNVVIDGKLDEWNDGWMLLNRYDQFEQVVGYNNDYRGPQDLWARVALKWDDDYLYFAGEVHDDVFYAEGVKADLMWQLDDFQIAFLYDPEGKINTKSVFEEISFAKLNGKPTVYRNKSIRTDIANVSEVENYELAIEERNGVVYYEAKFPWSSLLPSSYKRPYAGSEFKFGLLLNENDGIGRKGYYKLGDGIANTKDYTQFLTMYLYD